MIRSTNQAGLLRIVTPAIALIALFAAQIVRAAEVVATVLDQSGKPLSDAVVTVESADASTNIPADDSLSASYIDQKDEMFVPIVAVIRPGGAVTFHNSDRTRHHVYSFSEIHPFELVLKADEQSAPVKFDKAGVAAIGCNIHDLMFAFVYVTNAPRAAITDSHGLAKIQNLPIGKFIAKVWHPFLRRDYPAPTQTIELESSAAKLAVTISVTPPPPRDPNSLY